MQPAEGSIFLSDQKTSTIAGVVTYEMYESIDHQYPHTLRFPRISSYSKT